MHSDGGFMHSDGGFRHSDGGFMHSDGGFSHLDGGFRHSLGRKDAIQALDSIIDVAERPRLSHAHTCRVFVRDCVVYLG